MFKSIAFVITFIIGFCFSLLSPDFKQISVFEPETRYFEESMSCKKILSLQDRVSFTVKRIVDDGSDRRIELIISNKSCSTFNYYGYSKNSPVYEIKVNGKQVKQGWCGTGLEEQELKPGESVTFSVVSSSFPGSEISGTPGSVGITFREINESRLTWSDEFEL